MITNTDRQLFQYRNASRLNALIDGFYAIAAEACPDNLENFFNIDLAVGDWLTQLAGLYNVKRSYLNLGNPFLLDLSLLDSASRLDGYSQPVPDIILRALLRAKILQNTYPIKSIDYIINVFNLVVEPEEVEIIEGDKTLTINIIFPSADVFYVNIDSIGGTKMINGTFDNDVTQKIYLLKALQAYDPKWFGLPTGVTATVNILGV